MVLHGRGALSVVFFSLFIFFSLQQEASAKPTAQALGVCERRGVRGTLDEVVTDPRFRMSFRNEGGMANGGVCWWHSRFQRAVWTLAEFRPDLPKPTRAQAARLIYALAHLSRVVLIPGYSDFMSFSADFQAEIQSELNLWQLRDGFIHQAWIRGLSGQYDLSKKPQLLKRIMDQLFRYAEQGRKENFVPWMMLQLKGIVSHAALLTSMRKEPDGYSLSIVDSNYPEQTIEWKYRYGDGHMEDTDLVTIPYQGLHRDVLKMKLAVQQYCPQPESRSNWVK